MNTEPPPSQELQLLTAQLFRYAQDMDELMQQHDRLQQQHQMVLQSVGLGVQDDDLLTKLLQKSAPLSWVSNPEGVIIRCDGRLPPQSAPQAQALLGLHVARLVAAEQSADVLTMLQRFADNGIRASAVQCRLQLGPYGLSRQNAVFDVLVMQVLQAGSFEIHWFLRPMVHGQNNLMQVQCGFAQAIDGDFGVLLTDPHGNIAAVNRACCSITGYAQEELVGNNPRLLSSGRHDAAFYQNFWLELLDRGKWSGTIFNRRKGGQIFLVWQVVKMVENLAGQVVSYISSMTDLSYNEPTAKRLQAMAYTDPLTGLPNRRMLVDRLNTTIGDAATAGQALAVLFIDLNRFKPINDELGHEAGDLVLQQVASRMREALTPGDFLARVGGDEFVVLLSGARRVEQAEAIGAQLQQALQPSMLVRNQLLQIGASIGCASYPQDGEDMVTLLQHADTAMYGAKRLVLPFCRFDAGMDLTGKPNLDFELWQALERGEISLVYQPQFRSDGSQSLRGCEALMRWNHSLVGEVDPTTFIALAENSGAIIPLGNWALSHACEQLRDWRAQGMPDITLSLNVSLRQLRAPEFAGYVQKALTDNQLPPHMIELELSETQAMLFVPGDTVHVQALRQLGVRIAIDDFGTSFNSLARLNALSISSFKINPQCVQDLEHSADARAISSCMLAIGKAMGIEVIAQGVETQEQAEVLLQQGCEVIQGFYAGHPMTADTLLHMLKLN